MELLNQVFSAHILFHRNTWKMTEENFFKIFGICTMKYSQLLTEKRKSLESEEKSYYIFNTLILPFSFFEFTGIDSTTPVKVPALDKLIAVS